MPRVCGIAVSPHHTSLLLIRSFTACTVGKRNYIYFIVVATSLLAGVIIFDYLVWRRKHHRRFYAALVLMKSVCRPLHPEEFAYPRALVFAISLVLQSHLGRHVPDLDHSMVNTQPCVDGGHNDLLRD